VINIDSIEKLGMWFKERNNPNLIGTTICEVIAPPPKVKIRLNEHIILENDRLVFAAHLLAGYKREFTSVSEGSIITKTPPPESYDTNTVLESLNHQGEITYTDTIKAGDEVILVSTTDSQRYFVIDKAVRL